MAENNTGSGHSDTTRVWKDLSGHQDGQINGAYVHENYVKFDGQDDWVNLGELPTDLTEITLEITVDINKLPTELDDDDYIYPNQQILIPKNGYSYYITAEGDTLDEVIRAFNSNRDKFLNENKTIYLMAGQLLVNKK